MDQDQLVEHVHDLQVSLQDGDDLARAIALIGDALQRRMGAIRGNLEELSVDGVVVDHERLKQIIERVSSTLDRYEEQISERHQRMEDLVEEFQDSLGSRAAELEELEPTLGGPSGDGRAGDSGSSDGRTTEDGTG